MQKFVYLLFFLHIVFLWSIPLVHRDSPVFINNDGNLNRIGDFGYPDDPLNDRAIGYLEKGAAKTAVINYGNFITWDYDPAGLWKDFSYLPHVGFMTGIPGHEYSSNWIWSLEEFLIDNSYIEIWSSYDAYLSWFDNINDPINNEGHFKTIVINTVNDRGDILVERFSINDIILNEGPQWILDHDSERLLLYLNNDLDPNYSNSYIGLAYPWSIRPSFYERSETFDYYDYGDDEEEWTADDDYEFYGSNTAESWFTRDNGAKYTDWQATINSNTELFNNDIFVDDIFSSSNYESDHNILAHSQYPSTWPEKYNIETGFYEPYWPGKWGREYFGDDETLWSELGIINCDASPFDDDCWKTVEGKHISDMDIYFEFDDRWAHRGNQIENNKYQQTGYPMGLKVMSMGHSFGNFNTEDMLYFSVKIRNESGDYCAFEKNHNGTPIPVIDDSGNVVCGEGMVMPDGTKINRGQGFDYKKVSAGIYFDADVLSTDALGNFGVHTNDDDYMKYIDCLISTEEYPNGCPDFQGESLRISMAVIGDYDGVSNAVSGYSMDQTNSEVMGTDFGVVAVQLLDSPYATDPVDLDQDGFNDIFSGEKLKMTDWHWFDWYGRPGVVSRESNTNCCAGEPGRPQALNKEEIQYKLMVGDTTNLTDEEKERFFHSAVPETDLDSDINPHFDSNDGLKYTSYFIDGQDGMDCVFQITTGTFDLEVGEEVNLSFAILFGSDLEDLKENAKNAQILYDHQYSIPPSPSIPSSPNFDITSTVYSATLSWDSFSETSIDYLTNTQDFQGYRIYKSQDGGENWGDVLYDENGNAAGWHPLEQFDLVDGIYGPDPLAPWIDLGDDTGLQYTFTDSNLFSYNQYCYILTAYDSGLDSCFIDSCNYNINAWTDYSAGVPSLESSFSNMQCVNLETSSSYSPPSEILFESDSNNIGFAEIDYIVHDDAFDGMYKFEIRAEVDSNSILNSKTLNPTLFVYEVNHHGDQISDYIIEDFSFNSIDDGVMTNDWLDILGMYIKIDNLYFNFPENGDLFLKNITYSNELLEQVIDIKMKHKSNLYEFYSQPYFDYKIDFSNSSYLDSAYRVGPVSACDHMPTGVNTPLPFKITNITLDNEVLLWHMDKGIEQGMLTYDEVYAGTCFDCNTSSDQICIENICQNRTGYKNCNWEYNEILHISDIVDNDDEKYYEIKINFNKPKYFDYYGVDDDNVVSWFEDIAYSWGDVVLYEGLLYKLIEEYSIGNNPDTWFDIDGDYLNDNPWKAMYPWENGDSIEIFTPKILHDGDSWFVDLSKIGDCSSELGDVDENNVLNVLDIVSTINFILDNIDFSINQKCKADFNQDGEINIIDVVEIVNEVMAFDDDFLNREQIPSLLKINFSSSSISIPADIAFGGIHIFTKGTYSIREINIPKGYDVFYGSTGIVIINWTGSIQKDNILISYNGEMEIINHLASDLHGNVLLTSVIGAPTQFKLKSPYPNPFNPITTINFEIPTESQVFLFIYDIRGRQIETLINSNLSAGYHSVVWDANAYSSGVYFVKMMSGNYTNTQKLMLIK